MQVQASCICALFPTESAFIRTPIIQPCISDGLARSICQCCLAALGELEPTPSNFKRASRTSLNPSSLHFVAKATGEWLLCYARWTVDEGPYDNKFQFERELHSFLQTGPGGLSARTCLAEIRCLNQQRAGESRKATGAGRRALGLSDENHAQARPRRPHDRCAHSCRDVELPSRSLRHLLLRHELPRRGSLEGFRSRKVAATSASSLLSLYPSALWSWWCLLVEWICR